MAREIRKKVIKIQFSSLWPGDLSTGVKMSSEMLLTSPTGA